MSHILLTHEGAGQQTLHRAMTSQGSCSHGARCRKTRAVSCIPSRVGGAGRWPRTHLQLALAVLSSASHRPLCARTDQCAWPTT